ncbi:MAG: alpha/beta hydrolase [Pseudomonadales bacterium]
MTGTPVTHFVANGALQTAYHDVGDGAPFVLVHGFTGSKLDFQDQLSSFVDLRRVIALDQRGHGESSNQAPYSVEQLAADLLGFLDALDIDRCDLLGHSLGGVVAARAVLRDPARFRSLVLMDTPANPIAMQPPDVTERINALVRSGGCEALLPGMRRAPASPGAQPGIDLLGETEHWRRIEVKLQQMDPEAFVALSRELREPPSLLDALGDVACPTTVLVGEHDHPFVAAAAAMAARIPSARLVTLPDAGHCPQYENAAAWRQAVREHLNAAQP